MTEDCLKKELTPPQVFMTIGEQGELSRPQGLTASAYAKHRQMRRDPTIALARALSVAPILASSWSVESEPGAPVEMKAFISKCVMPHRMNFIRTAMFGCADFGWQSYEKVIDLNADGQIILKKLKPLLHDVTEILVDAETGEFVGIMQDPIYTHRHATQKIYLAAEECLLVSIDVEGTNWYGEPLMKTAEGPYDQAVEVTKAAGRYDRKIAGAHWVVYYPLGVSKVDGTDMDNAEVAKRILARLEASGSIAVPRSIQEIVDVLSAQAATAEATQWKIELLNSAGGQTPFIERLKYLDALKMRAFGMPERSALEGQFGTKAEAESHGDFAITNMELRHQIIVQAFNEGVTNQLLRLNYGHAAMGQVYVQPAPIADRALAFVREVYKSILSDPNGFLTEVNKIDLEALKDKLSIPVRPESDISAADPEVQAITNIINQVIGQAPPQVIEQAPQPAGPGGF